MAERAATGGRTHLRGMRERTDTATNAIAQEKRSQHRFSMSSSQSSNTRSPFKLVTDGSVLKNDIKQQLAKERREEKRRQQDATKEMQLLEKERKAKIQYEKQMEEKQRKLREQKQKDEQRRISAEEKRKQKLREDKEKFKAVVSRTLERNNHIERVKRSEASMTVNSESKMVNKPSVAIEKLEQETSGSNKQRTVPSSSLQNSVAKSVHNPVMQYTNMPLLSPSRDELKNTVELFCKSTVAISPQEKKGIPLKVSLEAPLEGSAEVAPEAEESVEAAPKGSAQVAPKAEANVEAALKGSAEVAPEAEANVEAAPKGSAEVAPKAEASVEAAPKGSSEVAPEAEANVEAAPKGSTEVAPEAEASVEAAPKGSTEVAPEAEASVEAAPKGGSEVAPEAEASVEAAPKGGSEVAPEAEANVEATLKGSSEVAPEAEASVEAAPKGSAQVAPVAEANVEATPKVSMEAFPEVSVETLSDSVEISPVGSEDVSLVSVDPSPEVSMDSSSEVSFDSPPEVSMETSAEETMELFHKANMKMIREESLETIPEESMEEPATANVKVPPESCPAVSVETSSKVKVRDTPQKSNPNKKRPLTQVPLSRWPSASGWCSSYPFSAKQIQKNHPPSFFLVMAEQPAQPSLSGKALPVQYDLCAQNVLDTIKRKKESVSKTTTSSETLSREHVTDEESARKGSQGIMSAEEETNILAAKQHLAHEPREKEEKLQKEMEQRKEIDVARKEIEGQEVFSKFDNGQRQKKITKKKRCQDQQNQKMLLQKGDSQIKAQEEANECQKEQEKSVLWNLPERSERKKRFEEIMKRTRKTNLNTSKVSPTAGTDIYEEHEADDEDESESDDANYFDLPASTSGVSPFRKTKASFRNVKRIPRLLFLDVNSDKVYSVKKTSLKSDVKNLRQKAKDPLAQAKGIRLSTNTIMNQVTKTDKAGESSNTMEPPRSLQSMTQESTHDQILDITSEIEPLESDILPDSQKHYLKGSLTFYRSSQIPLEDKDRDKSDSASSDI
ncbi:MAP7 domain-containing protein 3 isoform X2 [Phyllostomus discolor]|uniref:MAP7 domain-containing protein 3 isoform X2 n=1 Tax=Phyllostomus discolor TaxID=89673 RepID=A0A7E6D1X1_9CHIR|nr:MAP7 domain-containing protein 3 isoform X2 [Phyllostomus discolor]